MANPVTTNFGLQLLVSSQAQKDVVVNVDLTAIDALLQPNVLDIGLNVAPTLPADQDKHVVGIAPTGVWTGHANAIAVYQANGAFWTFYTPQPGWIVYSVAQNALYAFVAGAWTLMAASGNSLLGALANLTPVNGNVIIGNGTTWITETPQQAFGLTAAMYAIIFGG